MPKVDKKTMKGKNKDDNPTRIAVVNPDQCHPEKCGLQCSTNCPINRQGKKCIVVDKKSKRAQINEPLCIGCNLCQIKCPFKAISIINLPSILDSQISFRYDQNSFRLHRLPMPRQGSILGLVGENGTGKSTALQILSDKLRPNFGDFDHDPDTKSIIKAFRGTDLQNYFTALYQQDDKNKMHVDLKVQYVDALVKTDKADRTIRQMLAKYEKKDQERYKNIVQELQLEKLLDRQINQLSGGELQRFALAYVLARNYQVMLIDEPSSYLDVKQRLVASRIIRNAIEVDQSKYCIVVEHDLAVLDYLSDYVSILYGQPGVYGIITLPFGVNEGINEFLSGEIKVENVRIRDEPIKFKISDQDEEEVEQQQKQQQQQNQDEGKDAYQFIADYPEMYIELGDFKLHIQPGSFYTNQITLILGENGTGKSTFVKCIAGGKIPKKIIGNKELKQLPVSFKPQTLNPGFGGTVKQLFNAKIPNAINNKEFKDMVVQPLKIEHLFDHEVKQLSGGELQRVATILALGKPAEIYLFDEPSAYLDVQQRLAVAKVIKRYIKSTQKCCYVVEHDFLMSLYLADRVVVFEGEPGKNCTANPSCKLNDDVTFRRDASNYRPRVNKPNSAKDKDQKIQGKYFSDFE